MTQANCPPIKSDLLDDVTYHSNSQITIFSGFLLLLLVEAKVKYRRFKTTLFELLDTRLSIKWPLKYMQFPLTCPFNMYEYLNRFS